MIFTAGRYISMDRKQRRKSITFLMSRLSEWWCCQVPIAWRRLGLPRASRIGMWGLWLYVMTTHVCSSLIVWESQYSHRVEWSSFKNKSCHSIDYLLNLKNTSSNCMKNYLLSRAGPHISTFLSPAKTALRDGCVNDKNLQIII